MHTPGSSKTCVYDNPVTRAREYWVDGELLAHISANYLALPHRWNDGFVQQAFKPGAFKGEMEAVAQEYRNAHAG